jgi:electron transfer flavoprotein beta subunit
MRIAVCLKAAPATPGPDRADAGAALSEWDACALEQALILAEQTRGEVTALCAGGDEASSPLRRALALGARKACRIAVAGDDPFAAAHGLAAYGAASPWDIALFGAQSPDRGGGQVGGMVAAMLGMPFASLVTELALAGGELAVLREIESRRHERYRIALPCVLSVQTGINQPRYLSVRGIQRAVGLPVESFEPPAREASGVSLVRTIPPAKGNARMLDGDAGAMAGELAAYLRARAGL